VNTGYLNINFKNKNKMEQEFVIEKNIPIRKKIKPNATNYPFDKMEIGDSFFVKVKNGNKLTSLASGLSTCAREYAKRHNLDWKFLVSSYTELNGARIWRVK